jgi:hypothetical protein
VFILNVAVGIAQPNITKVEYFIDADPGIGNGTVSPITAGTNIANQTISFNPTALSPGVHFVGVRSRDANGFWSFTSYLAFARAFPATPQEPSITNINRVEYFIDADPGIGNATASPITAGTNIANQTISFDPTALTSGVHFLGIRSRAVNGSWSLTSYLAFAKAFSATPQEPAVSKLTNIEYFIDADPGIGNAIPIAFNSSTDVANAVAQINVTGIATGAHKLGWRSLNAAGAWSQTGLLDFTVPAALAAPTIVLNSITQTTRCAKDSFYLAYDKSGTYNAGNVFNAELSNAAGSFASPVIIGSYTGTGSSIIRATLPLHLPDGINYKVRVSSTNPVVTGIASTSSITIHDRPNAQTVTGAADANTTFSYPYSVPTFTGSTWTWIAPAATIAQTNNSANLTWNIAGQPQMVKVIETNQYGCVGDTSTKNVNVYNLKIDNVVSSTLIPCPAGTLTVTGNATGVYNAGNIFTAQLSDASGSFTAPVTIGTAAGNPVGLSQPVSINATLPFPLANGAGYRVRIIASSPAVTGADNGQNIVVNKPNLGVDQTVNKCLGFTTDITTVFNTTGLTVQWNTATPSAEDIGVYQLIVTNANGCKDTANVTVSNYPKPNLGADKSTTIGCANGTADLTTVYNTTGLTAVYNTATPTAAPIGSYTIIVTNTNGCKDTANITVLDASTATVPTSGSNSKTASRECTDAQGWTHYYYDNGTPTDYSDDIRLLSVKKNGNNIGTIGDGTFQVIVAATSGAGTNHGVNVMSPLVTPGNSFLSMNRYWNITPKTQPASSVGVRFYYNIQDLTDINGDYPSHDATQTQLSMYKLQGGNPDPTTNWAGATANNYYTNGANPSLTTWAYTDLGNNRNQAEFLVSSFSGGGAGIVFTSPLPVTLVSFNADVLQDKVQLKWVTATEINSKEFNVQRSLDGNSFETIATIPAAGNSSNLRNYVFDDFKSMDLKGKIVYYRVAETDIDGKLQYSNTKAVKIPAGQNSFTLVYNPVQNEALLKYDCTQKDKVQVCIIDHLGRIITKIEQEVVVGTNQFKMNTANLANGVYEIQLIGSNNNRSHVRMVKE